MRAKPVTRIIDAHHHLWDLEACAHAWLLQPGRRFFGDPASIAKNYHVPDFRADFGSIPVVKSVHIQVGVEPEQSVGETQWISDQAEEHGLPHAIVAFCDLTQGSAQSEMDRHQASANFRGVRQIVGRDAVEDARNGTNALLENPVFEIGLQSLIERSLSFDLQLTPPLLPAAAKLFQAVEDLPVALCHAGSLQDFTREGLNDWELGLRAFAEVPQSICKLSGFGMFDHDWTVETVREKVLRAIDIFTPARVAFGSNFPVDKLTGSYMEWMNAYMQITEGFSNEDRALMFADVAEQFYKI